MAHDPVLTARAVTKSYGATPALRGASVNIDHPGEVLAVTGPSGCGKSTLLHCLSGILRPDSGEIWYGRQRLDTLSEADRSVLRRTEIGVLFQFGQLVTELTALDNVAMPLLLDGSRRRSAHARAREWLDRLNVGAVAEMRPGEMSGGQQQRVALCRALVTSPRILFADEPTGALDSLASEKVLTELVRIARDQSTTVVLVTHDAKVAAYADREIALRDGELDVTGLGVSSITGPLATEATR